MKNYINILVPTIILTASTAFAQNQIDDSEIIRENVAEYEIVERELTNDARIYEETTAIFPVAFEDEDAYKLNQDRIVMPPSLETTFKLDTNNDKSYEREMTINYVRPNDFKFDFLLTEAGLKVGSIASDISIKDIYMIDAPNFKRNVQMLSLVGTYEVLMTNGETYKISVTHMK
jgi:hypothetical protein